MKKFLRIVITLLLLTSRLAGMKASGEERTIPVLEKVLPSVTACFEHYDVIVTPDKDKPEWWAGAPSVLRDRDGVFWLACRMRTADGPRGLRGYEIRILRSEDGIHFQPVHRLRRESVPIAGFERPALLQDPESGKYRLYGCGPWKDGVWSIIKFDDADRPDRFVASTARPVIQPRKKAYPRDIRPDGYKDPVILHAAGAYHCYAIGTMRRTERIYHFTSGDGLHWEPVGSPMNSVMDLDGWHDFYVRPASLLPLEIGYLFIYEGSNTEWYDPVYNMGTGVAFTFDLNTIHELTTQGPLAVSSTPSKRFHTLRYSHWMHVGDELWIYAEAVRPNESHEIRLFRLPKLGN